MTRDVRGAATLLRDYASVTGARIASVLLSLASVVITTRLLEPDEYAILAFVTIISTIVAASTAWTAACVTRYGRELLDEGRDLSTVTWNRAVMVAAPLVAVLAAVVGVRAAGLLPSEMSWTFTWLALLVGLVLIVGEHVSALLEAAGRMKLTAVGWLLRHAAIVGVLATIFIVGWRSSAELVVVSILVASTVVAACLAALAWRVGLWPVNIDRALLARMFRFSLPLVAFTASFYFMASVDLIVIRAFGSAEDAGVYAVAYQGYSVLQAVATAPTVVLVPLVVSLRTAGKEGLLRRYFERVVPGASFLSAVAAGLVVPFVPFFVTLVFGEAFSGAGEPLVVLLGALVFYFASSLIAPILVLYERTVAVGLIYTGAALVNLVGDLLLVGAFNIGIIGAAVATLAAMLVILVGNIAVARHALQSTAAPNVVLLIPLLAGLLPTVFLPAPWSLVAGILGAAGSAALVLAVTRPFAVADADLIEKLDMPERLRRVALRALALVAR